jgi:threonyl-tRNA synthetase
VIGEKEVAAGTVSVRKQGEGDRGVMKPEEFISLVKEEIKREIGN